jgi:hypothetical protein
MWRRGNDQVNFGLFEYRGPREFDLGVKKQHEFNQSLNSGLLAGFRITAPVSLTHVVLVIMPSQVTRSRLLVVACCE